MQYKTALFAALLLVGAGKSKIYHPAGKLKGTPPNPARKTKAQRKAEKRARHGKPKPEPMRCGCGHEFDGSAVGAYGCANCNGDNGPAVAL